MITNKPLHRLSITSVSINASATDVGVIYGLPGKWRVRKFTAYDASTSLAVSIATLGLYTGAGGTGTVLAALAAMTALSGVSKCWDFSLAAGASSDYQTGGALYIRCGVAHGSAATVTVILEIEELE